MPAANHREEQQNVVVRQIPGDEQIIRARIDAANITFVHEHEQELAELLIDMRSGVKK